jgi:hypothetical protein
MNNVEIISRCIAAVPSVVMCDIKQVVGPICHLPLVAMGVGEPHGGGLDQRCGLRDGGRRADYGWHGVISRNDERPYAVRARLRRRNGRGYASGR